jgi:hypothetical protein
MQCGPQSLRPEDVSTVYIVTYTMALSIQALYEQVAVENAHQLLS